MIPRTLRPLAAVLLALVSAACATGMETPEVRPAAPVVERPPVDPAVDAWFRATPVAGSTTFVAGDRLRIELHGLPEYTVTREVPPDGTIPLVRAGRPVDARGRTPQELEADVAAAYAGSVEAYVTVTLVEAAPRTVYVAGAVRSPQAYPLRPGERLTVLQAITLAGGPTVTADLSAVTIMRYHTERAAVVSSAPLDVQSVQARGDQRDNLAVLAGDTVVVPEGLERQVHVLGLVERPGPLRWYEGLTLSRAVTEAGGFRKFARTSAIRVVRGGRETIGFDFTEMLAGRVEDLVLEPGDVVYVDEKWI